MPTTIKTIVQPLTDGSRVYDVVLRSDAHGTFQFPCMSGWHAGEFAEQLARLITDHTTDVAEVI